MPSVVQVPWKYVSPAGEPTYYRGTNRPVAVVLHRMQGWATTAHQWALSGHYGASWHYTVSLAGDIMQHLRHEDGGYHAGIGPNAKTPTWPLWRGHGQSVNTYTIGVECEGFAAEDWPTAQLDALRWLCRKLSVDLGIPYNREHFPAHAEIDVVNRVNDFDSPGRREAVYAYLFEEEEEMADPRLDAVVAALGGMAEIEAWNARGNSLLAGYALEQEKLGAHLATPHGGPAGGRVASAEQIARAIELGAKAAGDSIRFAEQANNGG